MSEPFKNRFPSGVEKYIIATATVEASFPLDRNGEALVYCKLCPFYRTNQRCGLNGSPVAFPEKYVGQNCPLEAKKIKETEL